MVVCPWVSAVEIHDLVARGMMMLVGTTAGTTLAGREDEQSRYERGRDDDSEHRSLLYLLLLFVEIKDR